MLRIEENNIKDTKMLKIDQDIRCQLWDNKLMK